MTDKLPRRRRALRAHIEAERAAHAATVRELTGKHAAALGDANAARRELAGEYAKRIRAAEHEAEIAQEKLAKARQALLEDGYFTPDQVDDDIAPRIVERLNAMDSGFRLQLADVQAEHLKRVAVWDQTRKRLQAERDSSRAEYRDAAAERDRLRGLLAACQESHKAEAEMAVPPPEPAVAATPAPRKPRARKPAGGNS